MKHILRGKTSLTEGSIGRSILLFALPLFLGQLLQQLYNLADAWVIGNFAGLEAFAAVSSSGSVTWLVIGFFNGVGVGGGVVISRYFGAKDPERVSRAIHTCFLFGLAASVVSTAVTLPLVPALLRWMSTPDSVMPAATAYFNVYFGGVSTIIMYNICMSIMRAIGDSIHPLYYLILSSVANVLLDLLFVAVLKWDVTGAAVATVISQGLSAVLCILRMRKKSSGVGLELRLLRWNGSMLREVLAQGLPTGIQNSVISIGNIVIQANVNSFGSFAMSGRGAYSKIEGFVFLPITCMAMTLPTFVGQNLGARQYDRAKKGAVFGILSGMALAELIGVVLYFTAEQAIGLFIRDADAVAYGLTDIRIIAPLYFLLAFSHCAAGVLRGCGKSVIPMVTMLAFWCGLRILYVTLAMQVRPVYPVICWAYPITWTCSCAVFLLYLLRTDWTHGFEPSRP